MADKIKKLRNIANLKAGDQFIDIFVVKFKKPVQQYRKGYMFELRIGDASGEIMLKYWGDNNKDTVEQLYNSIKKDDIILVNGSVGEFNGQLDISVNKDVAIKVCPMDSYDIGDFILMSKKDIEEMFKEFKSIVDSIEEPTLKKLLDYFLNKDDFIKELKSKPAAMYKHHAWGGGLLEHILDMVKIANTVLEVHPELNRDLLLSGIIFHDLGKIKEFEMTTNIKTSKTGILKGHLIVMIEMLTRALHELKISEDEEIVIKLSHMIVSHHGKLEYGSPKIPAFPEAMALYQIDELNSKLKNMITSKENAKTEDDYIYTKDFGNIYLK